jgi:adenylate cyclase
MSNVFISYARSSEEQATQVEKALRDAGYDVWRDAELPAHRNYAEVIEERLKSAKAVVVLWSAEAVKSEWVRAEADAARGLKTLVQVSIDGTLPPIPFNQTQCADLSGWDGRDCAGWRKINESLSALVGTSVETSQPSKPHRQTQSVCVLPFANMSGDAEQEYFSDGISEDITTDLSKISALAVTARNTAFQFKGQSIDVSEVAKRLGVRHVLEGSVRKAGNRVRITAQLIDGETGDHVWADRYDRDLTDIFEIQDEISEAIVEALKLKLLPEEKKAIEQRGTSSVAAYSLYLIARKYFTRGYLGGGQHEEKKKIVRICKRAVELDPTYAKAWGLMAWAQSMLFTYDTDSDDGVGAAKRALSLDPTVAGAHCVIARHLLKQGRAAEADAAIQEALNIEPDAWEIIREAGRSLYNRNRFEEAVPYFERALAMVETDYSAWQMLASAYKTLGDDEGTARAAKQMLVQAQEVLDQDPGDIDALATSACGSAILGDRQRFNERIELALLLDPENALSRYNFACTAAAFLNEVNLAIDLLEPVLAGESAPTFITFASLDPDLKEVRKNPRFERMLSGGAKDKLAAAAAATPRAAAERE